MLISQIMNCPTGDKPAGHKDDVYLAQQQKNPTSPELSPQAEIVIPTADDFRADGCAVYYGSMCRLE